MIHASPQSFYPFIGIAALVGLADVVYRVVPFFRKELKVEAFTRLTPLDGLRGLLCFGVLYHHAFHTRIYLNNGLWDVPVPIAYNLLGKAAVALFFCVTGFLFWGQAISRQGNIPFFPFIRARFFRIAPLYLFTMLCVLVIGRHKVEWTNWKSYGDLLQMLLMGARDWAGFRTVHVNLVNAGVIWTLPYEWGFYFALPALAHMLRAGRAWHILVLAMGLWIVNGLNQPPAMSVYFLSGILAAHVSRMPNIAGRLRTGPVAVFVILVMGILPWFNSNGVGWTAFIGTTLIFVPIACGNSLFGFLNIAGLRLMGTISYSVYLLHGVYLFVARPWLARPGVLNTNWFWIDIFALSLVVLIGCTLTYRFVEWPGIVFEKRLRAKGKAPIPDPAMAIAPGP